MNHSQHPRPQLERARWRDLSGTWRFSFAGPDERPESVNFDREIRVPYPPESEASGIHDTAYHPSAWYATTLELDAAERGEPGDRVLVHFGAVDYEASVWANGELVAAHTGGHTPFTADITSAAASGRVELVVRATDDPHDLRKPRGKQDWRPEPHAIWYPRTTGIWQTVWLETVPAARVERLRWTPNLERWEIALDATVTGAPGATARLRVRLFTDDGVLVDDEFDAGGGRVQRRIALPDPGIDDAREDLLWFPHHPQLISAELEVIVDGRVADRVRSYTAMRAVNIDGGRFQLNARPFYLRMVLDQGYWPKSLMTATDDELRRDVELTKRLGFNGARKHQKLESPRWLYWCDALGLVVWDEMPSAYAFDERAVERLTREWIEAMERDYSHPCVVAWVPFNESWGVPDLTTNPQHRDYVKALYHLTRALDPTRPAIGNDGWEQVATDILTIHDYDSDPARLHARYVTREAVQDSIRHVRPGGRMIALEDFSFTEQPVVLSEFGGIAFAPEARPGDAGWGYSRARSSDAFLEQYRAICHAALTARPGLSGFCYTQLTDTFQEINGVLFEDRTPKADITALYAATRGETLDPDNPPDPFGYSPRWTARQRRQV